MSKAILYDSTLCIGCRACESACAARWGIPYDDKIAAEEKLSAHKLTAIETHGEHFSRRLCMNCVQPACASVCPVGALEKTAFGPVTYDADKCMGCRYCMQACPFEVPRYEWGSLAPKIRKCRMCYERVAVGGRTACADACQFEATNFGTRDEMIREARRRIDGNPGQYIDYIYGLQEAGGTSVMFISNVPFEKLGFPMSVPKEPIPGLSWRVLSQIPRYTVAAGVVLFGIHWITRRRTEVARFEAEEKRRAAAGDLPGKDDEAPFA